MNQDSKWRAYSEYKASGIEWLREVPQHWVVGPLKFFCSESAIYGANESANNYSDAGVRFVRTSDIDDYGHLKNDGGVYLNESSVFDYLLQDGDLLLSRSGTIGRSFVYREDTHGKAAYAGYLVCFRLNRYLDPRFAFYFTKSVVFQDWLAVSVITSTIGNINGHKYANMPLPKPPLPEQRAIADFLDRETANIDALIAKKQRLIELLQEKRTALISYAVTKGLDPDVPMKDIGVEWLGDVPAHWELLPLRRVVSRFVDYRGRTPEKVEAGVPLITAANIRNGHLDFSVSQEFIREEDYDGWMVRGLPEVGDVLITTEAPLGATAQIENTDVALAQRIIMLKAEKSIIVNEYLKHYLSSLAGQGELWSRATGSTAIGIKAWRLREILVTTPPITEQHSIVALVENEVSQIDGILVKIGEAIEKLQEYRTALISAAVTGKIDVREEVVQ